MPRPFHCGTQFVDWQDKNCCHCQRYSFQVDAATGKTRKPLEEHEICQIELALCKAAYGDGEVTEEIAWRMAMPSDNAYYSWPCGEIEPTTGAYTEAVTRWRADHPNDARPDFGGSR